MLIHREQVLLILLVLYKSLYAFNGCMETVNHAFLFVCQTEDCLLSAFQYLTELKYYQGSRWRAIRTLLCTGAKREVEVAL